MRHPNSIYWSNYNMHFINIVKPYYSIRGKKKKRDQFVYLK